MANTKASLTQQNTQTYPSNTSGSITANAVKSFNNNFINAVATLGDTNVFTEPQTFGDVVQVNSDVIANNVYAGNIPYLSGSNVFTGPSNTFSGSVFIQSASIVNLEVQNVYSQSTIYSTGSNQLGDASNDTQTLWGTVDVKTGPLKVSGSVNVSGSIVATSFTGSLQGTSSWANNVISASHALTSVSSSFANNATSASYALNATSASYVSTSANGFPFSGSAVITGSLLIENVNDVVVFGLVQSNVSNTPTYAIKQDGGASTSTVLITNATHVFTGSGANLYRFDVPVTIQNTTTITGSVNISGSINSVNSTINASTRSIIINGGDNTITSASVSSIFNSTTSQILGKGIDDNFESNNNTIIGGKTSVISGSNQSTILGGSVRMNNVTASVALARDTAYTASANYTLFTQNIQSSGSVVVTGSLLVTDGITGSLQGTASYAVQALSASWAPGGGGTIDTGSFATTGSNVFNGSQTIQSQSLFLQASSSVALNPNFFTASTAGTTFGANTLMFAGSAQSGSFTFSGSRNVATINPGNNAATITRSGGTYNGNFGVLSGAYGTSSAVPVFTNNVLLSGITTNIPNTSSVTTLTSNFVGGAITVTGSGVTAVNINQNNIDSVQIINDFTSSTGVNQQVSVTGNLIKGGVTAGTLLAQIKFAGTGSGSNTRQFASNIMFGCANTASLEATGTSLQNLLNTGIIGSSLIVSGTMASNSLSASMFVGQFNDTTLADASLYKFIVGTGTTNAARRTSFLVSGSGEVQIRPNGDGQGISTFGPGRATKIADGNVNGSLSTVAATNAVFNVNSVTNNGSQLSTIMSAETSTNTSAANSVQMAGAGLTMTNGTLNVMSGESNQMLNAARSIVLGGVNNVMSSSYGSAIIGGSNVASIRMNTSTGSVALPRDAAYTASANYTLFTQNVNLSGSLTVNGNVQYNYGSYYTTASITLTANTSQSLNFTTVDAQSGFTLSGSNNEQIKATNAGVYNLQFSAQLDQGANSANYYIWLKKNGSNVADTAGKSTLASNHSMISAWNYVVSLAANDTLEIVIQSDANNSSVAYIAASGNIPAAPSVIATITQVK